MQYGASKVSPMAIFHYSAQLISKGAGRSAVCAAAYRHGATMKVDAEDKTVSYTHKDEVVMTGVELPTDAPDWIKSALAGASNPHQQSEYVWNVVEAFEKRHDAQFAREVEAALPVELSEKQNIELIKKLAKSFTDKGMIADWAYHGKEGNPHVHMMLTLRPLVENGFGAKAKRVLNDDGKHIGNVPFAAGFKDGKELKERRAEWAEMCNSALQEQGYNSKIDHRSHAERGIDLEPTIHVGQAANGMSERGIASDRIDYTEDLEEKNHLAILRKPEAILALVNDRSSVFDKSDIAKVLNTYISDKEAFNQAFYKIMASPELVQLSADVYDHSTGEELEPAKFTTKTMIAVESELAERSVRLQENSNHSVSPKLVSGAIASVNDKLSAFNGRLTSEQEDAIEYLTHSSGLSNIVGFAGAGKSTILEAAREAWEGQGYKVTGLSLSGKAVEGLQQSSGIDSRTIASFDWHVKQGRISLSKNDILVIDEAGMVGSVSLGETLKKAEEAGAKVVLVGDPDQLQPISAGAAYRSILERTAYSELTEIRRQKDVWAKEASKHFAKGEIKQAINLHSMNGSLHGYGLKERAVVGAAIDFMADWDAGKNTLAIAHTNKDVAWLNHEIRAIRDKRGELSGGLKFKSLSAAGDEKIDTFSVGDRIVFRKNDNRLGVKNGKLGIIEKASEDRLSVRTEDGKLVSFDAKQYTSFSHGYAVSIHKSQGATVDTTHILGSLSLTKNLAYVAFTRHKEKVSFHYGSKSFRYGAKKLAEKLPDEAKSKIMASEVSVVSAILGRPDEKSSTLDFEDNASYQSVKSELNAINYGARRGLNSQPVITKNIARYVEQGRKYLSGLANRLESATKSILESSKVQNADWFIPPTSLPDKIDDVSKSIARDEVLVSKFEEIRTLSSQVFKDSNRVLARLETLLNGDSDTLKSTVEQLKSEPQLFGDLRGDTGLFVSKADKYLRSDAINASVELAASIRDYVGAKNVTQNRILGELADLNKKAAIGIPNLSSEDWKQLEQLSDASQKGAAALGDKLEQLQQSNPSLFDRVEQVNKSIKARYGGVARMQKQLAAVVDKNDQKLNVQMVERLRKAKALVAVNRIAEKEKSRAKVRSSKSVL